MSNQTPPFMEITPENEKDLRDQFCHEVGHTNDCINATVHEISESYRKEAFAQNIHPSKYLDTTTIEVFDAHLRRLLLEKPCNCGRTTNLN